MPFRYCTSKYMESVSRNLCMRAMNACTFVCLEKCAKSSIYDYLKYAQTSTSTCKLYKKILSELIDYINSIINNSKACFRLRVYNSGVNWRSMYYNKASGYNP